MVTIEDARAAMPRLMPRLSIGGLEACWEWTGAKTDGYGQIQCGGRVVPVTHVVLAAHGTPVPDGLTADHLCRNHACGNPSHLEVVPNRENVLRGEGVTAINARKTHCDRGHEFTEANTYLRPGSNWRECVACRRLHRNAARSSEVLSSSGGEGH